MSLYAVDRVFYDVLENDAQVNAFVGDSDAYLAGAISGERAAGPQGLRLRRPLVDGRHPLILMRWVRKVQMARGRDGAEAVKEYQRIIEPLGRPDYST